MNVFISWSGPRSHHIATALRDWLPDLIQSLKPWMSKRDIDAGARWSHEVAASLESSTFGILVVTPENTGSPWLNFEAGAIARSVAQSRVCPYLYELEPSAIPEGPLTQFQAKRCNREETRELVQSLNSALESNSLDGRRLDRLFNSLWPQLDESIKATPEPTEPLPPPPSSGDALNEILDTVRRLERTSSKPDVGVIPPVGFKLQQRRTRPVEFTSEMVDKIKEQLDLGTVRIRKSAQSESVDPAPES